MAASEDVDWDVCEQCDNEGGIGICLPSSTRCWAHAMEQEFDAALKRLDGEGLDARGVPITPGRLKRILAAVPHDAKGFPQLATAFFDETTFKGGANFDDAIFESNASFDHAIFDGKASFDGAIFKGDASFDGAIFKGEASFERTTFKESNWFTGARFKNVSFDYATFEREATFDDAIFKGDVRFEAKFKGGAIFSGAAFKAEADFASATFKGLTGFSQATFEGKASFSGASFKDGGHFTEAIFKDEARFGFATFERRANFNDATFEAAQELGPILAGQQLSLDRVTFKERVQIEAAVGILSAQRARFPAGVQLRLRWAEVVLDDADLAVPSILTGVDQPFPKEEDSQFAMAWKERLPKRTRAARPRLLSIRRADVAGLAVSNVDLRPCLFIGAHNLDKLRIEGELDLSTPPGGWRGWRWSRRRVLAEEHHWRWEQQRRRRDVLKAGLPRVVRKWLDDRAVQRQSDWQEPEAREHGWYRDKTVPPRWLSDVRLLEPVDIAALYRALRKGREDSKDEPGAADFYYGEMEMRRHTRRQQTVRTWKERRPGWMPATGTEYAILSLYWLVSGYGLRAWRALVTLLALLGVFAALLAYGGGFAASAQSTTASGSSPPTTAMPPQSTIRPTTTTPSTSAPTTTVATADTSFGGALIYGARTVIGLARNPQPELTRFGDVLQILLRILGPVLLGLAVLSVRGRVKR